MYFFFFSSRRRHTRLQGDWSSDVCAADLAARPGARRARPRGRPQGRGPQAGAAGSEERRVGKECRSRWWPYHSKKKDNGEKLLNIRTRKQKYNEVTRKRDVQR